jgi:hypothetical protein
MTTEQLLKRGAHMGSERTRARAVEVWCPSLDRWVQGFDLVESNPDGCIVRRLSDGEVLPISFSDDHVRSRTDPGSGSGW